ncbi:MAG: DnaJ domain-containing protein [Myxococcales bacterium]|nr:DnaJ domain-containing protein [Myxococcales bacterium]
MEPAGTFDQAKLAALCLELMRENYCGGLVLQQARNQKSIIFDGAEIAHAESNITKESLLARMAAAGEIDAATQERVRSVMRKKKLSEEHALMALQVLAAKELVLALRERTRERVRECFSWASGEYRLEPETTAPKGSEALRVDGPPLVLEGLARHARPDALLQRLEAPLMQYPRLGAESEALLERLSPAPETVALARSLDPEKTLWDQLGMQSSVEPLAALFVMSELGALSFSSSPGAAEAAPDPDAPDSGAGGGLQFEILVGDAAPAEGAPEAGRTEARTTARDDELAREIEEKFEKLAELDHYELLGVPNDAKTAAIKKAYLFAAKRFHPDALKRHGLESLKAKAGEVFAAIGKAHSVLSDSASRREYDEGGIDSFDTDRLMQAETFFRQAEIMMRAGRFGEAAPLLENTVKLWPEEGAYQAYLGWALFKKRPSEPDRAREHLEKALELRQDAQSYFYFSVVLRKLGEFGAADTAMARAKELDPSVG